MLDKKFEGVDNMEKKYFFFDIDGTLTDSSTGRSCQVQERLERLEANGHFVAIATGRAHYKARKFTESNGFKNMVCCGGNGCVINNELVENIPLGQRRMFTDHSSVRRIRVWMVCSS